MTALERSELTARARALQAAHDQAWKDLHPDGAPTVAGAGGGARALTGAAVRPCAGCLVALSAARRLRLQLREAGEVI